MMKPIRYFAHCGALLMLAIVHHEVSAQFIQQGGKLVGTGAVGTAEQGCAVSLSSDGNTALVGGFADNSSQGAAWVFTRTAGVWSQQGSKLVGTGAVGNSCQGYAVSLSSDGNTALVGGYADNSGQGAAWVFTRTAGVWSQQGEKLVGTGAVGGTQQGTSVSISSDGNTVIVGGPGDDSNTGGAWVFTRNGGVWSQQGEKLVGAGAVGAAWQGYSVSLSSDGNTALVGARADNDGLGAVWVFTRAGGVWSQQGSKLVGTGAAGNAQQGTSVSLSSDGNTAIVGGSGDNNYAGATWVFTRSGGVWSQQGSKLIGTGAVGTAAQGRSVSLASDGNTALIGGSSDNSSGGLAVGAAWVFTRRGGVWSQQGNKLVGTGAVGRAFQGQSVSISLNGNTAIVGGYYDNSRAGAAWVFLNVGPPSILSVNDVPHDQGGRVQVRWQKSHYDTGDTLSRVQYYSIWRAIPLGVNRAGRFTPLEGMSMDFSGAAFRKLSTASEYDWEWLANQPSHNLPTYAYTASTLYDSMATTNGMHHFLVSAHTSEPIVYWDSRPDSGWSVDNLSPAPPANPGLEALAYGAIRAHWNKNQTDPDMLDYVVYRSTQDGFSIADSTRRGSTADTVFTDSSTIPGVRYYYRITSCDIHGNESVPTDQLALTAVSTEGEEVPPRQFSLDQNYPNPFNPTTTIRYELPKSSMVRLSVYDILGREVYVLVNERRDAGLYEVTCDASALASGVYLYRLQAGDFVQSKSLIVLK